MGEAYACRYDLPVERFPADWKQFGKSAGFRRNKEMAFNADALIAFNINHSAGTENMIKEARAAGLAVRIVTITENQI